MAVENEYTIKITLRALKDIEGGGAYVNEFKKIKESIYMPVTADFDIEGKMFAEDSEQALKDDLVPTVIHEVGHILGVGSMFHLVNDNGKFVTAGYPLNDKNQSNTVRNWLNPAPENSSGNVGFVYRQPKGVEKYEEVFKNGIGFLPISSDGSHVFTFSYNPKTQEYNLNPWVLPDGTKIPLARNEVMADGKKITVITLGILDDLGWEVDYTKADSYN